MKINRFGALAAIVLLVVGAMGAIANQSFAMDSHNTTGIQAHTHLPSLRYLPSRFKALSFKHNPVPRIKLMVQK